MTTATGHTVVDSPVGPLTLVASGHALSGVHMAGQRHRPPDSAYGPRRDDLLPDARGQLAAYFTGELTEFDLELRLEGTEFQRRVWSALLSVPFAATVSYGQLAATAGRPGAARAVGMAVGRNPVGIVVPCHRVVGADGSLTGYGGGLDRKRWLLGHEAAVAAGR